MFEKDQNSCSEKSQEKKGAVFLTRACVRTLLSCSHVRKPQDLDRTVVVLRWRQSGASRAPGWIDQSLLVSLLPCPRPNGLRNTGSGSQAIKWSLVYICYCVHMVPKVEFLWIDGLEKPTRSAASSRVLVWPLLPDKNTFWFWSDSLYAIDIYLKGQVIARSVTFKSHVITLNWGHWGWSCK